MNHGLRSINISFKWQLMYSKALCVLHYRTMPAVGTYCAVSFPSPFLFKIQTRALERGFTYLYNAASNGITW